MSYLRTLRPGGRLRWAGLFGLVAALSICLMPGIADAKKKKKGKKNTPVKVLSYNLYLGSDLGPATNAGLANRTDLFANEVGNVLSDVQTNDFAVRAQTIAQDIKKQKVDVAGLQEAALWKLEIPTDGGGPPRGTPANVPLIDYIDTLLNALNANAKTKKQCKAKGLKGDKCYRGYYLVGFTQEADVEQIGDFDNNPGPNGDTFDLSDAAAQGALGAAAPSKWLLGNDDTPGVNAGEPPAPQCSDGIDNDGDGKTDYGPDPVNNEESGPGLGDATPLTGLHGTAAPYDCESRVDNSETDVNPAGTDPPGLPQDANFDHSGLSGNFPSADNATPPCPGGPSADCPTGVSFDSVGNGLDRRSGVPVTDCPDNSADDGPEDGTPNWPFSGVGYAENNVPVCMFHGIDGDIRLQMRDAIIARKGVKTSNVTSGNYAPQNTFKVTVFGTPLSFTRGWVAADVNVNGKKFHLLNTHLESESIGSIREDQAQQLVSNTFGLGAGLHPNTVLVGDLNSDPARAPTNLPNGDGGSNIAINRLFAAGYMPIEVPGFSGGHAELLNNLSNTLDDGRIDHILTNNPLIRVRSGQILDSIGGGLWASDHGGVVSRLDVPGGKKKGKKKK